MNLRLRHHLDGGLRRASGVGAARAWVGAAAAVSLAATVAIVALPSIHLAYRRPMLHASLEATEALIALLVAYLVFGRVRRTGQASDVALFTSVALLAATNLCFGALPTIAWEGDPGRIASWAAVVGRFAGAALFAAAAFTPSVTLRRPRRAVAVAVGVVVALLGASVGAVAAVGDSLPAVVSVSDAAAARPDLSGNLAVHVLHLAAVVLFAVAAVGYLRRAERTRDALAGFLAAGAVFAAFARVNYFLYPSLYSEWVYWGDGFRLLFYLALLVGAGMEIRGYWERVAGVAVLEERRRLARDLHDGLAQELAYIVRRTHRLPPEVAAGAGGEIASAARRALTESRRAIAALSRPLDEPLDLVLAEEVRTTAERVGTSVDLDLRLRERCPPAEIREALVRIACEAVANAGTHGGADRVRIHLSDRDGLYLRVVDDGAGFDEHARARRGGFGLVSMRERASRVGGHLRVSSQIGRGTEVEVVVP